MTTVSKTIGKKDDHSQMTAGRHVRHGGIVPAPYFRWKGLLDRCLAVVLLVPGLPLICVLVLLVRLTSRGPGIYRQARVGKDGRRFMMYKIRTMRQDAESASGPVWTQPRDPRVTPIGKILRKNHLDELPQLFNVLLGNMSLVGPRPERPEFVGVLAEAIPGYRNRLAVLPGVTGLAQVNLPPDSDIISVQRKLVLDCEYIEQGSLWLDARLMLGTFLRIFKLPEDWVHRVLGLRRDAKVESTVGADSIPLGAETVAATPASILLQIGDLAELGDPSENGHGNGADHGPHSGHGMLHRNGRDIRRGPHADRSKPR